VPNMPANKERPESDDTGQSFAQDRAAIAETLHCRYFFASALIKPSALGLPHPDAKS
jgi:hypothetical protein